MKKQTMALMAITLLSVLSPCLFAGYVTFQDAALEAAVASELGSPLPIRTEDMLNLTYLTLLSGTTINSLVGLESAENLECLVLYFSRVESLEPLSNLQNLRTLYISGDISQDHLISDLLPISSLSQLESCSLTNHKITDITALDNWVGLGSISKGLDLSHNTISDISIFENVQQFGNISLFDNLITDISPLSYLRQVGTLKLAANQIQDISCLSGLEKAITIDLSYTQIDDISPLAGLTSFIIADGSGGVIPAGLYLNFRGNQINDISIMSDMYDIRTLDLRGNPLDDTAYSTYLPQIIANNTGIEIYYDPVPEPASVLLFGLAGMALLRNRRK